MGLDNFDSSATTSRHGFEDPKGGRVALSLALEKLVVFWEQVTDWCDEKVFWVFHSQTVHITPQQVFPAQLRAAREVVSLLVLVEPLDVIGGDVACPLDIEVVVVALDHCEARVFASVNHSIVDVSWVGDLERHEKVLDFIAVILANTVRGSLEMTVTWVREERSWGSSVEDRLEEVRFLGVRLEYTVRESGFLAFDKDLVQGVVFNEVLNFLQGVDYGIGWCLISY